MQRITLPCLFLLASGLATAQDRAPMDTLVVTASRNALEQSAVGSSLTLLSRADIEASQADFLADLLRSVPGLDVSANGPLGSLTQVRIRGAEGNHTLVLINGIQANDPVSASEFDFGSLLLADVERVEILKGPQSALYGSDAIGGVINIITRTGRTGLAGSLRAGGGSNSAKQLSAGIGGGSEALTGRISLEHLDTDGTNVARNGSEDDGYENTTVGGQVAWTQPNWSVELTGRHMTSESGFDPQDFDFPPTLTQGLIIDGDEVRESKHTFAGVTLRANSADDRWRHRLATRFTDVDNRFFADGAATSGNDSQRLQLEYLLSREVTEGHWANLALEHESTDYSNRGATATAAQNQSQSDDAVAAAFEYVAQLGSLGLSVSARRDWNDLFEDASSYRVTASLPVGDLTRLHSSVGTGVTNPTFFELYGFFPQSFVGNPDLEAESSFSYDIGIERRFAAGNTRLDLTWFNSRLEDEIVTVFDFATFLSGVENLSGKSRREGLEFSLSTRPHRNWRVQASYTYTDSEQPDGRREVRRARHRASLHNTFTWDRVDLQVAIDHNGSQEDNEFIFATPEDRATLDAFNLVRVALQVRINPRMKVYGRVDNALDETYEEIFSYRGPGRTFWAGFEFGLGEI